MLLSAVSAAPAHRGAAAVLAVAAADKAAAGGCRPSAPVGRDLLSSPQLSYRSVLLLTPVPRRLRGNKDYLLLGGAPRLPFLSPAHTHSNSLCRSLGPPDTLSRRLPQDAAP